MTTPSPAIMSRFTKKPLSPEERLLKDIFEAPTTSAAYTGILHATVLVADTQPEDQARLVRPGFKTVTEYVEHDGVVKAKHLKKGMTVRAFLHGKPCGGERVVDDTERIEDGAKVRVSFTTPHPTTDYKAAYRFYVKELAGTPVAKAKSVPALVPYEEV